MHALTQHALLTTAPMPPPQAVPPASEDPPYKISVASRMGRQATCSCKQPIARGALRLGTRSDMEGMVVYKWRHLACVTKGQVTNMRKKGINTLEDVAGAALLDVGTSEEDAAAVTKLRQLFA